MRKKVAAAPKVVSTARRQGVRPAATANPEAAWAEPGRGRRALGIHPSLISQYERGYLRLHGALLVRFAQVLATTPGQDPQRQAPRPTTATPSIGASCAASGRSAGYPTADKRLLLGTIDAFLSKVS